MDASFLHLETPETPMHVGSLMVFELPEGSQGDDYEDVKAMLGKRLHPASVLCRRTISFNTHSQGAFHA
jgi:hypothetical protein